MHPVTSKTTSDSIVQPTVADGTDRCIESGGNLKIHNRVSPGLKILSVALVILGFVPMMRMIYWLYALGGNSIGNDYVHWIKIIDGVMSGTFNWLNFPGAVFLGSHYCFFSILCELAMCKLGVWDVRLESLIGILLLVVSTWLLWDATTTKSDGTWRWLLLACSAAINFGTSQSSILLGGMFSLRLTGLCQLGYTLALWSLIKLSDRRRGAALALVALGGILASYSCGASLPVWGSLMVAVMMLGPRKISDVMCFFASMFVGLFPYAYFYLVEHRHDPNLAGGLGKVGMNPLLVVDLIGRPLCNGLGQNFGYIAIGHVAGMLGLGFLIAMLICARGKALPKVVLTVVVSLICFSLTAACLLLGVRAQIAPWYATMMKYFWLAYSTLAVYLFKSSWDDSGKLSLPSRLASGGISVAALTCFLTLYLMTNVSFDDKQFYLLTRTPASESCQRNYRTAPTYGESLLFQWAPGNQYFCRLIGSILQKHRLLSFSTNQEWTLQGDFFLNRVSFNRQRDYSPPSWVSGNRADRVRSWRDYNHLNLCLKPPQTVKWRITLPDGAGSAKLETSCARAVQKYHQDPRSASLPIAARVAINSESGNCSGVSFSKALSGPSDWSKIEIPLAQFVGQPITVSFTCIAPEDEKGKSVAGAVFQYPKITFNQQRDLQPKLAQASLLVPENTDISPEFHQPTSTDLALRASPGKNVSVRPAEDLLLSRFSHLYFKATAGGIVAPVVSVKLNLNGNRSATTVVPLLLSRQNHAYTYDLKLLELPCDTTLSSIDLTASSVNQSERENTVISDVRLLRVR